MKRNRLLRSFKIFVVVSLAASIFSFATMWLWNWLMPAIFGLHAIRFWQALGLLVLSKILFGGFRGRPGFGAHWRGRMRARWEQMTPEEREKFRQGMARRCGRGVAPAEASVNPGHV